MFQFKYQGETYEASAQALRSYAVHKALANFAADAPAYYKSIESIFGGKDEEYAERLGGTEEGLAGLLTAALEALPEAKN